MLRQRVEAVGAPERAAVTRTATQRTVGTSKVVLGRLVFKVPRPTPSIRIQVLELRRVRNPRMNPRMSPSGDERMSLRWNLRRTLRRTLRGAPAWHLNGMYASCFGGLFVIC